MNNTMKFAVLVVLLLFISTAHATIFITDANVTVVDSNRVRVYVECYDESGNITSGNVTYSVHDENYRACNIFPVGSGQISCNNFVDIGEYPLGSYCLKLVSGGSGNTHTTFFNIQRTTINYASIDELNFFAAFIAVCLVLGITTKAQSKVKN
ncbi:MAG: hypothetical protein QXM75_03980 [Candidatus Diapherotrites archaeon]